MPNYADVEQDDDSARQVALAKLAGGTGGHLDDIDPGVDEMRQRYHALGRPYPYATAEQPAETATPSPAPSPARPQISVQRPGASPAMRPFESLASSMPREDDAPAPAGGGSSGPLGMVARTLLTSPPPGQPPADNLTEAQDMRPAQRPSAPVAMPGPNRFGAALAGAFGAPSDQIQAIRGAPMREALERQAQEKDMRERDPGSPESLRSFDIMSKLRPELVGVIGKRGEVSHRDISDLMGKTSVLDQMDKIEDIKQKNLERSTQAAKQAADDKNRGAALAEETRHHKADEANARDKTDKAAGKQGAAEKAHQEAVADALSSVQRFRAALKSGDPQAQRQAHNDLTLKIAAASAKARMSGKSLSLTEDQVPRSGDLAGGLSGMAASLTGGRIGKDPSEALDLIEQSLRGSTGSSGTFGAANTKTVGGKTYRKLPDGGWEEAD